MTDQELEDLARELWTTDDVAVDPGAEVSRAEDGTGAWVQAWVWVDYPD